MFGIAKFLHLLALMLGAAGGIGNMALTLTARRLDGPPPPAFQKLRPFFAWTGIGGIALIWVSGLWLYLGKYDGGRISGLFDAKLACAGLILLIAVVTTFARIRAVRAGTPPPAWAARLVQFNSVLLILAVALAVAVFG